MSDAEAATLRERLQALRSAGPAAGAPPLSAKTAFAALRDDPALAGFVTTGRIKKLWTRLNAEAREEAAADAAASEPPLDAAALPRWPDGKSLRDALDKGDTSVITLAEKLQSVSTGSAPMGVSADYDFRQSLLCVGQHLDNGVVLFNVQDEAQSSAITLIVRGVRVQPSHSPLFEVEWAHAKRTSPHVAQHLAMMDGLIKSERYLGVAGIAASLEEQELWLAQLRRNTVAGACTHAMLRRSSVAAPPPAGRLTAQEELKRPPGQKVCAFCRGAAKLTCAGCEGVHYCDATCQRQHWSTHKRDCRPKAPDDDAGGGSSVVIPAAQGSGVTGLTLNFRQAAGASYAMPGVQPQNPHGARRFLIKCQVPLTGGDEMPVMIYDETRALSRMLFVDELGGAPYKAVAALVRRKGTMGGAKAYLWAKREGTQLRIYLDADDLAPQQQAW